MRRKARISVMIRSNPKNTNTVLIRPAGRRTAATTTTSALSAEAIRHSGMSAIPAVQ
jgi:hypothetical protein